MFGLTNLGWLIFRERDLGQLIRDLTLSPLAAPLMDWRVAWYLFLLTFFYSLPLWMHTAWDLTLAKIFPNGTPGFSGWFDPVLSVLLFSGILLLRCESSADFIYFQF